MASPVLNELDPVQLQAVQEVLLDPSLILRATRDSVGTIVDFVCEDASHSAADALEVALGDLIGSLLSQTLPVAAGAFLFERCVEAVATAEPMHFDDYQVELNEETHHYDIRGLPLGDRVWFTWRDITERFRNEQALAESMNRYRLLAENASDVVLLLTPDGRIEWASSSSRDMLGWCPEDLIGREFIAGVHPEDRPRCGATQRHPSSTRPQSEQMRLRSASGTYFWAAVTTREIRDGDGLLVNRVASVRNIHKKVQAHRALEESQDRFRTLAENVSDVVLSTESGIVTWVSPSISWVLGRQPETVIGRPVIDLVSPDDLERAADALAEVTQHGIIDLLEMRFVTASGEARWMQVHSRAVDSGPGPHHTFVTGLQDIHERRAQRVMLEALSAVNAVLVRADDEAVLLAGVCQVLVEQTAFALVWFCRGRDDGLHEVVAIEGDHVGLLELGELCGCGGADLALAPIAAHTVAASADECRVITSATSQSDVRRRFRTDVGIPIVVDRAIDIVLRLHWTESLTLTPAVATDFDQLAQQVGMAVSRIRARRQLVDALNEQALLTTAIEQAGESVVIADLDGTIVYANPATVATTGYPLDEIIGETYAKFASSLNGEEFWDGIVEMLAAGQTWRGVLVSRNRRGDLYEEDSTVTAVRDETGSITAYVSVLRNISRELKLEADLDRVRSDRKSVVEAMRGVRVGSTIESTAASFCRAVVQLEDIELVRVLLVQSDSKVTLLDFAGRAYLDWEVGVPVSFPRLGALLENTHAGPWWLTLSDLPAVQRSDDPMIAPLVESGYVSVGFAPVWWEGSLVAVLIMLSRAPESEQWCEARATVLGELSSFAGSVLGAQAAHRGEWVSRRDEIRDIIDRSTFRPVFQPVVVIDGREAVGYEALTRFDNGRRPDLVFQEAHAVGLGIELELACATAGVWAAVDLAAGAWLAVNFSPDSIIAGSVGELAALTDRPLVVEITEHVEVESYVAVRAAVGACPGVRISVDDAGAGYASLRHILELHPDFVKLDIGLVHNIDVDPARQALAAGLRHYAEETGNILIAEGVETPAECATLRRLGIPLAQGFLFGRPAPTESPAAA